jgi:hypothetical protein
VMEVAFLSTDAMVGATSATVGRSSSLRAAPVS